MLSDLPVVVIGAGPVGLSAAANLAERAIPFLVIEAGAVADTVRSWGHVRLFSPWRELIDPAARRLLEAHGWHESEPDTAPTGRELVEDYLLPLSKDPLIAERLRTGTRVIAVSRRGTDRTRTGARSDAPFIVRTESSAGIADLEARAVIDASGTFLTPNPLGSSGLDPLDLGTAGDAVIAALPDVLGADRDRFAGRRTAVVGAGHSAATTLLALDELARTVPGTHATWVIRGAAASRVVDADELADRGSLGRRVRKLVDSGAIDLVTGFEIDAIEADAKGIRLQGRRAGLRAHVDVDLVVSATGFRPDLSILRELRLDLDEVVEAPRRLAPLIDPNVHTCGTVEPHGAAQLAHPEPDLFIVGMKSYGRAPTFLLATGYEQVRSVVASIAGDEEAARRVQLVLPATGVCSTTAASCC